MLKVSNVLTILSTFALIFSPTCIVLAQDESVVGPTLQLLRQSVEQVVMLHADPEPFQAFIGEDFKVAVEEGKTRLLIVTQDSKSTYLDGDDVGPSKDVHIWVEIEGSRRGTHIPVIGATVTLGTMTWFKLFGGSSHPKIRSMFADSGLIYESVEELSLVHSGSEILGELAINSDEGFSWDATFREPRAKLLGVNHDFYARNGSGGLVYTQIQAIVKVLAWACPGTLQVKGSFVPGNLLPSGTYQVMVNSYDPIWIRASINVPAPE